MKETTPVAETTAAEPTVKINREKYVDVKSASGKKSLNNGDPIAVALTGIDVPTLYGIAAKFMEVKRSDLEAKYSHLNIGMQRMNLGNRIRGACAKIDGAGKAGDGAKALVKLVPVPVKK